MDPTITCPKCGAEVPLSEAVSHRIREQLAREFEIKRREQDEALTTREGKLRESEAALEKQQRALQQEIERRLAAQKKDLLAEAARQAQDKLALEMKDLQSRLAEQKQQLDTARAAELNLRKRQRELEDAKQALELEVNRKLDEERGKIHETAKLQATEEQRLRLAEKEKLIGDLQKQIDTLKQKAERGSMQLQGETLELELESQLRAAFPFDEIAEVKKGQRGADVTHRVRTNVGLDCGSVLWEAKRARNWSADWPEKLKADQREARAELAVIVTTCPPEGVRGFAPVDGVWVCEPPFAVALAAALRQGLISTAAQRVQQANRADKAQAVYDHLCSVEFRQHVEALVESFLGLKEQLDAEQRAFARQWKEREQQLQKAITHTAMLYGGVQGIAGREALPEIQKLALPAGAPPGASHAAA
jgi:hypothetical protein